MRKAKKFLLAGLATIACAFGFSACNDSFEDLTNETEYTYDWTYVQEFVDECDADMTIDGKLDEARWEDAHWLYHGEDNVKLAYTTVFSEKGLYIGAKADDEKMQWNARFNFSHFANMGALNSAFWFQVSGPDVVDGHAMRLFNFFVDPFNRASRNQTRFAAETTTNGDILKGEATQMVSEVFISWDALNIELGENGELPEFVYLVPSYRYIVENDTSCIDNRWIIPTGTYPRNMMWWNYEKGYAGTLADFNYYRAKTGIHFNQDGYINYDQEGSPVGMSANGICKSDGWDLSKAATTGEVSVIAPYEQFIFIKDVYAEKYHLKVDLVIDEYADGNPGNEWPSIGLATVQSGVNSRCFYISGKSILDNRPNTDGSWGTSCSSISLQTWKTNSFGAVSAPVGKDVPKEGFSLELVKDGSVIYYIVEGQLVGTDNIVALAGKACPALFSIGGRGTYKNIQIETDSDKVTEVINKYVRTVSVETQGSGTVMPDKYALKMMEGKATNDLTVTLYPDVNYVVEDVKITGLTIDESESWDFFLANYKDGKLKIAKEYVKDHVKITAKFTRIRAKLSADQVVEVSGTLTNEKGEPMVGAQMVICNDAYQPIYYTLVTSSTGNYSVLLPKEGSYTFGEHTLPVDGVYRAKMAGAAGYKVLNKEINLCDVTEAKITKNFGMEILEFQLGLYPTKTWNSSSTYTINGSYLLNGVHQFKNKSVAQDQDFVVYTTIDPTESSAFASEFGFIIGTGDDTTGNNLFFVLKSSSDTFSGYIWTNGNRQTHPDLGYHCTAINFTGDNKWMKICPYGENKDQRLEMALVYKDGSYSMYLNGCLAFSVKETANMGEGYPTHPYEWVIGTEGDKKLGIMSLNAFTAIYDWGFATDAETIAKYVNAEDRPQEIPESAINYTTSVNRPALYAGGWMWGSGHFSQSGTSVVVNNTAYKFDDVQIKYGDAFMIQATINPTTAQVGFLLSADDDSHVKMVFRPAQNDIYLWGPKLWKDKMPVPASIDPFGANNDTAMTITLVYKDHTYYVFFDDALVVSFADTVKNDWGGDPLSTHIGKENILYLGLASADSATTFTDWKVSTLAADIEKYVK